MSSVDDFLSEIPLSELAGQLGVSEAEAEQAARLAVPALMSGMRANARDPAGAASLAEALGEHEADAFPGRRIGQVDTTDGNKIVDHIFGAQRPNVVNRLGEQRSGAGNLVSQLLPIIAPLVMSWLARRMGGAGRSPQAGAGRSPQAGARDTTVGLDDLLGGMLGASDETASDTGSSLDMGDVLGDLLGGGTTRLRAARHGQEARSTIP